MSDSLDTCPRCNGPQIEIDHYGELARRLHRIQPLELAWQSAALHGAAG